ncbi:MAG: hypothetical protein MUF72_16730 [Elainella sp. Prado103]|jgi:hypothetical protein|nr:hypothetical protein [Elainella sp. Prado103]
MVLKLLGLGKKSEYFLEAPPAANGAESTGAEKVKEVAKVVEQAVEKTVEKVVDTAEKVADTAADAVEAIKPAETASVKASAKKMKKSKVAEAEKPAPAPAPVVKSAPAPAPTVTNFATDGLMPMNMPRRRPGPSLNMFKDMARDVTPRK